MVTFQRALAFPTRSAYTPLKLEAWLMTYATLDPDHVAKYWEPFLYGEHSVRREMAVVRLSILTGEKEPSTLAYRLLTEFLGQEPTEDKIDDIIKKRFLRLFPGRKGSE